MTAMVTAGAVLSSTVTASAQDDDRGVHIAGIDTEDFPIVHVGLALDTDGAVDIEGFSIREDGLEVPFTVDQITEPLTVVLAIDVSGSMAGPPLESAKSAARECLANLPAGSQTALISYADFPVVASGFSDDTASLNAAIESLTADGETATYDTLWQAGILIGPSALAADPQALGGQLSRFVVLLSDGEDTVSSVSQEAAIDSLQVAGASVFAVAIESNESDHVTLNTITSETDGLLLSGGSSDLDQLCTSINSHLSNRYLIRYESAIRQQPTIPAYVKVFYKDSKISGGDSIALTVPSSFGPSSGVGDAAEELVALPVGGEADGPIAVPTAVVVGALEDALSDVPNGLPFADEEGAIGAIEIPADLGADESLIEDLTTPPAGTTGGFFSLLSRLLGSPNAVWAGAAMVGAAIAMFVTTIFSATGAGVGTVSLGGGAQAASRTSLSSLTDIFSMFSDTVDRIMNRGGSETSRSSKLNLLLDRAGMAVRPAEVVTGTAVGTGVSVLVTLVAGFRLIPLVLLIVIPLGVRAFIKRKAKKRTSAFKSQLGDTLMIMAGSVRAGHSLMRSVSSVAQQSPDPTAEEFNRVLTETRIGRDPIESLTHLADRIGSEDLTWTVRAMALNRELGGNLAEVLDNVGETIRDRNHIADQVRALSSEGKFSAYVLFALPFIVSLAVSVLNRGYLVPLFTTTNGYIVLAIGGALLLVGAIWIRNLINLEY